MVTISNRDKKMIIWNFMEELCDKHQGASENNNATYFNFNDFYNIGLFNKYLSRIDVNGSYSETVVLDTLRRYAEKKGFIKIEEDVVRLTEKGLDECQESTRDWD